MSWQDPQFDYSKRRREDPSSRSRDGRGDISRQALPPGSSNFQNSRRDLSRDRYQGEYEHHSSPRYTERQRAIPSSDATHSSAGSSSRRLYSQNAHDDEEYSTSEEDSLEDDRNRAPRLHHSNSNQFSRSGHPGHLRSPVRDLYTDSSSVTDSRRTVPNSSLLPSLPPLPSDYGINTGRNELQIDLRSTIPTGPSSNPSSSASAYPPYEVPPTSSFPFHDPSPVGGGHYPSPRTRAGAPVDPVNDLSRGFSSFRVSDHANATYASTSGMSQAGYHDASQSSYGTYASVPQEIRDDVDELLRNSGQFNLTGQIGRNEGHIASGGNGDVYCSVMRSGPHVGLRVAVKRLRIHLQTEPKYVKRALREIKVWTGLSHKNVLCLLGFAAETGCVLPSLITPFMKNRTVTTFLKKQSAVHTYFMLMGVADGVDYIHSKKVVHSDIKGENIMVDDNGVAVIGDFGSARWVEYNHSTDVKSTARWMAVELFRKSDYSRASDVWGIGMTFYEIMTGQLPFYQYGNDAQVIGKVLFEGALPDWPQDFGVDDNFLKAMSQLCDDCWEKIPRDRPSSREICEAIAKAARASLLRWCSLSSPFPDGSFHTLFDVEKYMTDFRIRNEQDADAAVVMPRTGVPMLLADSNEPCVPENWVRWHLRRIADELEAVLNARWHACHPSIPSCTQCVLCSRSSRNRSRPNCDQSSIDCSTNLIHTITENLLRTRSRSNEANDATIQGIDSVFRHMHECHRDSFARVQQSFLVFNALVRRYGGHIRRDGEQYSPLLLENHATTRLPPPIRQQQVHAPIYYPHDSRSGSGSRWH